MGQRHPAAVDWWLSHVIPLFVRFQPSQIGDAGFRWPIHSQYVRIQRAEACWGRAPKPPTCHPLWSVDMCSWWEKLEPRMCLLHQFTEWYLSSMGCQQQITWGSCCPMMILESGMAAKKSRCSHGSVWQYGVYLSDFGLMICHGWILPLPFTHRASFCSILVWTRNHHNHDTVLAVQKPFLGTHVFTFMFTSRQLVNACKCMMSSFPTWNL